jgi:ribosomal peptide maturation radical SAM protein 1
MYKVSLVNMPWADVNRPALGVSLLKANLAQHGFAVDVHYPCLRWSVFLREQFAGFAGAADFRIESPSRHDQNKIVQRARRAMPDEWVFSQCLYGQGSLDADQYVQRQLAGRHNAAELSLWLAMRDHAERFLQECLETIPWGDYNLVGFSMTFRQNLASLALARRIKERFPHVRIICGGANCRLPMSRPLMKHYPFIDFIAAGEADHSLPQLVTALAAGRSPEGIKGILWRDGGRVVVNEPAEMVTDLDRLPAPDFSDYFEQIRGLPYEQLLDIRLPLEQSRGCWWGQHRQCTFCGLSDAKYRSKSPQRALAELREALAKYPYDTVVYTDNVLDFRHFRDLLPELKALRNGVKLFFEIRTTIGKEQLHLLRQAGTSLVQPGVESFSGHVLELMSKGTTPLRNVQCLKWCRQFGIDTGWNLLFGFPGETADDYSQMLPLLKAITHLPPPHSAAQIRLDRFSPNFIRAAELGFVNIRPGAAYRHLYAFDEADLMEAACFFDFDYGDGRQPIAYTQEVVELVSQWRKQPDGNLIWFVGEDGASELRDTRFTRVVDRMELDEFQTAIYGFCDCIRKVDEIQRDLVAASFHEDARRLPAVLEEFVQKRMIVRDGEKYLAVALTDSASPREEELADERQWQAIVA